MSKHEELKRLLAAATPGEWSVCQCVQLEGDALFQIEARVELDMLQCVATDIAGIEDAAAIVALHNAAPALIADNERLEERVRVLSEALQAIDDEFSDAVQSDCENGVRSLNERAASRYLKEYPATAGAIQFALETARAALGEQP